MSIVQVVLDVPLRRHFDYIADPAAGSSIGCRVLVPFGNRRLVGMIAALPRSSELPADRLKRVIKIYHEVPALPAELLGVFEFCAGYYHHPLGQVVMSALPPGLRRSQPVEPKKTAVYRLAGHAADAAAHSPPLRGAVKQRIWAALRESSALDRAAIVALAPSAATALRDMLAQGLVIMERLPFASAAGQALVAPTLTREQQAALDAIELGRYAVWLLHGITGSGKTEVYLRLIRDVLAQGKQALVLVPEINLTPQLEAVFRGRFRGVPVASLHSGMAEGERVNHYLAAQSGAARIVLGTRLAAFTPLLELGLIIVDEEHDSSFKQQDGLRYSARDVAVFRAQKLGIPIVLGSATPSLESYHRARTGHYRYLQLASRAVETAELPAVHCVVESKGETGIAPRVLEALRERLRRSEQSLVFINRRGYAPVLLCPQCRWVAGCPRCSANLVLHGPERRLHCHHCGLQEKVPEHCPHCGNGHLRSIGRGTQRMEELLAEHFPEARILRIDRDSTRRKGALHGFLERIAARQVDILVGTQMLAKGHDFPRLTLVVVLNADASLYSPDFRAEERLFAQLLQVSGRAGRAERPGEVLVQTAFPDHPLYTALRSHDYAGFAESQLRLRREHSFPPYAYLAVLRAESAKPDRAAKFASHAAAAARALAEGGVAVFDPVPAPLAKLAGKERWQLAVQSASRPALQRFLSLLQEALEEVDQRGVRWAIDVDPLEL